MNTMFINCPVNNDINSYTSLQADGEYEWSNGWYVLYTRWSKGSSDSGNCVKMYGENGTWKGENCALKLPYLCKVSTGMLLFYCGCLIKGPYSHADFGI